MILVYCCSTTKILPEYLSDLLICLIIYYPKIQLSFAYQTLNKNFNRLKFQEACPTTNTLYPTWILKPLRLTFKTVHVGSCMGLCFLFISVEVRLFQFLITIDHNSFICKKKSLC